MDDGSTLLPLEAGAVDHDFDIVFRGYDRHQVDEHLRFLEHALQRAEAEAAGTTPSFEALGERVKQILRLAEEEAADIRAGGEREVAEAERRGEAAEIAAQARADRLLADAREQADRIVEEARAEAQRQREAVSREIEELTARREDIRAEVQRLRERLLTAMGEAAVDE